MPRSRAFATMRERHSHGRATSSGPRIHPEPSHMPSRQGWRSSDDGRAANSGFLGARELITVATDVLCGRAPSGWLLHRPLLAGPIGELRIVLEEDEADGAHGAVAVLGEDQLRAALILGLGVVVVVPVEEADHVRVLLDRAGFAEVGEDRALIGALLGGTGELR